MKKIYVLITILFTTFLLSSCDDIIPEDILTIPEIEDILEDPIVDEEDDAQVNDNQNEAIVTVNASEMVQVLSTGRSNFMPNMDAIETDLETGDFIETDDFSYYDVGCQYGTQYIDNGDGTFTQTFSYYDYDYNYYDRAYEMLYNGIDDDDDGEIDEDDEVLIMVTDEMTDGIDNNHNGVIDEYFEMSPSYFVTYTMTYGEMTTTTTNEDGVVTTTGSYYYEWQEVKEPYTGQTIEVSECYDDDTIDPDDGISDRDLWNIYESLRVELETKLGDVSTIENQISYLELTLDRTLTEEEKAAVETVMNIYDFIENQALDESSIYLIWTLEFYLNRSLTDEELQAVELVQNYDGYEDLTPELEAALELVENLYSIVYTLNELETLALYLNRALTDEEQLAIEIVNSINVYYDNENKEALTEEEILALSTIEALYDEVESQLNQTVLSVTLLLGRPLTEEEKLAFEVVNSITETYDENMSIDALISYYETILERRLTDIEIEALQLFEFYDSNAFIN